MGLKLEIDDLVVTKKKHPCGGDRWQVVRTGADVKLRCLTCGHVVMLPLSEAKKRIKKVEAAHENETTETLLPQRKV